MTSKIIPFPGQPISQKAKETMALELKKNRVERDLNFIFQQDNWDLYQMTGADMEMLALFGEVMKFSPKVSSRLISKLAELSIKISKDFADITGDPY